MASIAVFGAGYVGLVTGACFAELGHSVVVRDVVAAKIEALRRGEVPIHEPGLDDLLERNRARLEFTLDVREALAAAEFVYVCVDTPPLVSGDADLSRVWTVVEELPAGTNATIVMKSTVPVGTGERVRAALDARGLRSAGYVSNPEFTAEGSAVRDFMRPDRIVVGAFDPRQGDAVAALHGGIDAPVVRCDVHSAEMIKLAANAFLMTRVSFINEIANVCEVTGADVVAVAEGIGLDRRLGPHFLRAGIGYGGSCLVGEETAMVRDSRSTRVVSLERLFAEVTDGAEIEVLAWRDRGSGPAFHAAAAVTRRRHRGEVIEVRTEMGRRLTCTPDHPFVVREGGGASRIKLAEELTTDDWLPIAQGLPAAHDGAGRADVIGARAIQAGIGALGHPRDHVARSHDITRANALRLHEARALSLPPRHASAGTARNGTGQRLPDAIWSEPQEHKRALLRGMWRGEGSWSYVAGGPSVVLEYRTVSRDLADGILRLLGELGVVARLKVGRTARSTTDTYWLVVSGADQVEQLLGLVPDDARARITSSLARQKKRTAPAGYRREAGTAWVRVSRLERRAFDGDVYSIEVPGVHTFVATGGLVVHNCFPKDSLALKQLAANSGYHFQLLTAVIEVNELQKRRVVQKLEKHLGRLRGRRIALLGLAFKPHTDDLREAPSLVLASRLLAEGAEVRAWDPVADAGDLLPGATICETVLEAVTGADAAVIVTEWPELRGLAGPEAREAMANPLIVDGRNLLDPEAARGAGFVYEGIGRAGDRFAEPAADAAS